MYAGSCVTERERPDDCRAERSVAPSAHPHLHQLLHRRRGGLCHAPGRCADRRPALVRGLARPPRAAAGRRLGRADRRGDSRLHEPAVRDDPRQRDRHLRLQARVDARPEVQEADRPAAPAPRRRDALPAGAAAVPRLQRRLRGGPGAAPPPPDLARLARRPTPRPQRPPGRCPAGSATCPRRSRTGAHYGRDRAVDSADRPTTGSGGASARGRPARPGEHRARPGTGTAAGAAGWRRQRARSSSTRRRRSCPATSRTVR